jgi:hypothetical protein
VSQPNYSKQIGDVQSLRQIGYEEDPSPVMLLCHGRGPASTHPAVLKFGEDTVQNYVWACRDGDIPDDDEILQNMIWKSKLVLMLCCEGGKFLKDYLSEQGNNKPDILMYDCEIAIRVPHAVFVFLLINVIASDDRVLRDPYPRDVCIAVKDGITTILNIVVNTCSQQSQKGASPLPCVR